MSGIQFFNKRPPTWERTGFPSGSQGIRLTSILLCASYSYRGICPHETRVSVPDNFVSLLNIDLCNLCYKCRRQYTITRIKKEDRHRAVCMNLFFSECIFYIFNLDYFRKKTRRILIARILGAKKIAIILAKKIGTTRDYNRKTNT
jgi:hypothetical protein